MYGVSSRLNSRTIHVQDLSTWVQWTSIHVHGVRRTLVVKIFVENPKIIPNLVTIKQMGQFSRKLSQIKCSRSFNSCPKHVKPGGRVLQTLIHILPTGFVFKLSGWNMRSTLSTWYRCETHPKPGTRTLLLASTHECTVCLPDSIPEQFTFRISQHGCNGLPYTFMGCSGLWLRKYLSKTQGKNYPESGHKWVNF